MEGALVTSNFSMADLYPAKANAAHAPRSRRLSYISPAASSAAAPNPSYRRKKSTSPPPPSAAATATVLTSPPKPVEQQETEEHLVAPNILSIEHTLERMELIHASVELVRINLRTGNVTRTPLAAANLDFGVINPACLARPGHRRRGAASIPRPLRLPRPVRQAGRAPVTAPMIIRFRYTSTFYV
uniref:Predicted protein n=1 Tax=Hordeum vulgare subsp. vulgare TaxID=112509 RepID=F2DCQ6_HORVV|nr:predicted protein [Hordeum vulgare subsp. vulgare]